MIVENILDQENSSITMINPKLFTTDRHSSSRIARNKEQVIAAVMTVEQWNHTQVDFNFFLLCYEINIFSRSFLFLEM